MTNCSGPVAPFMPLPSPQSRHPPKCVCQAVSIESPHEFLDSEGHRPQPIIGHRLAHRRRP